MKPSPAPDLSEGRLERAKKPNPKSLPKFVTVIAIDPGETTGWALWNLYPEVLVYDDEKISDNIQMWTHGQVECVSRFEDDDFEDLGIAFVNESEAIGVAELVGLLRSWDGAAVVIESFILRQQRKDASLLSPVRITAALSQWLWQQRRLYFVQQPSMAKTTVTDARLKTWGFYERSGGMQHARDADRHAITFLRRCKGSNPAACKLRHKAWPHIFDEKGDYRYG
ncbi:RuvC-like resolvase [Gordonia phage Zany]|uniref:RuvC-like resolvase n=1 Tax=Gordonia phage Zany TaxID=2910759 RepID=A0AA49BMN8_9CAUD|nr:RuvC-like resolvase [Gordonia phage Zany]